MWDLGLGVSGSGFEVRGLWPQDMRKALSANGLYFLRPANSFWSSSLYAITC